MARFAVIGAGLAGVALADRLTKADQDCSLFEKNSEIGGRLATRQFNNWCADYGTQYFTIRSDQFRTEVNFWLSQGWVEPWHVTPWVLDRETIEPSPDNQIRYVGSSTMNRMVVEVGQKLDTYLETRIDRLEQVSDKWRLWDGNGEHYGLFDAVLITAPLAQSMALLPKGTNAEIALRSAAMSPTWVYAVSLDHPTGIPADAVFSKNSIVSWVARNSSKPNRQSDYETWVMHFAPQWTANHLDVSEELLRYQTVRLLELLAGKEIGSIHDSFSYRWLYARASSKDIIIPQWDANLRVGLAGDWTIGSRLEDAWLSAQVLAEKLLNHYS
jgi:predicted NAD/FAD-dependent oxidoreductase